MNHLKSKLGYITGVSLKRKIKTKWFLLANILIAIVVIGLVNIDSIISLFGGDFTEKTKVYVLDNANSYEILKTQISQAETSLGENSTYELVLSDESIDNLKEKLDKD